MRTGRWLHAHSKCALHTQARSAEGPRGPSAAEGRAGHGDQFGLEPETLAPRAAQDRGHTLCWHTLAREGASHVHLQAREPREVCWHVLRQVSVCSAHVSCEAHRFACGVCDCGFVPSAEPEVCAPKRSERICSLGFLWSSGEGKEAGAQQTSPGRAGRAGTIEREQALPTWWRLVSGDVLLPSPSWGLAWQLAVCCSHPPLWPSHRDIGLCGPQAT